MRIHKVKLSKIKYENNNIVCTSASIGLSRIEENKVLELYVIISEDEKMK